MAAAHHIVPKSCREALEKIMGNVYPLLGIQSPVFISYCCGNELPHTCHLKTTWIYCFIVSVSQESRHGLAGPPDLNSSYQSGCDLNLRLGLLSKLTDYEWNSFSCDYVTEALFSLLALCWGSLLVSRGYPSVLASWHSPSQQGCLVSSGSAGEYLWHFMLKGLSD